MCCVYTQLADELTEVPSGRDLRRQAVHVHETLRRGLVEGVALVVGGEVEVVQRLGAAPAVDRDVPAVQHHPDLARHVLLRLATNVSSAVFSGEYHRPS